MSELHTCIHFYISKTISFCGIKVKTWEWTIGVQVNQCISFTRKQIEFPQKLHRFIEDALITYHNFFTKRWTPCSGWMTIWIAGECIYFGERETEKFDKSRAIKILSSAMAKFSPRHTRGPTPNGMYKYGSLHAPVIPFANLSAWIHRHLVPMVQGQCAMLPPKSPHWHL